MSLADNLTTIAENVPKVYQAGRDADWNIFWDVYQSKGKRTEYAGAFREVWNDEIFKPKYLIQPTNGDSIFSKAAITNGELLRGKLDLSKDTNGYAAFYQSKFTTLPIINYSNMGSGTLTSTFGYCGNLTKIEKLILNNNGTTKFSNGCLLGCSKLSYIRIEGVIGNTINLQSCPLDKESIDSVISHLSTTSTGQTLILNKAAVNKAFGINVDVATTYPEGSEYYTLRHSRDNWTVSYA